MNSRKTQSRSFFSRSPGRDTQIPTFQPPSFYAAAAGIPYLPRSVCSTPAPEDQREWAESSALQTTQSSTSMIPISYPTQVATQDAPPRNEPVESKESQLSRSGSTSSSRKSISLTRSLSRALPKYNRDKDKQSMGKRKSQIVDIPFLETQLLPSLRDTIDRMTQPPRNKLPECGVITPKRSTLCSIPSDHSRTNFCHPGNSSTNIGELRERELELLHRSRI